MSIIIKGMKAPKYEDLFEPGLVIDLATGKVGTLYARLFHWRHGALSDWMEVVELPPHGDLIDRDAILHEDVLHYVDALNSSFGGSYVKFSDLVRNAPVIIPSNKEETE